MIAFDKMSDSLYDAVIVAGIEVTSRYRLEDEFVRMARVLSSLSSDIRKKIKSIDCDSQHSHDYDVKLRDEYNSASNALLVGEALHQLFMRQVGGHNNLCVEKGISFGGDWVNDDGPF